MKSIIYKLILFTYLIQSVGCGYFNDDPIPESEIYNSKSLSAPCQLKTEELNNIFKEDVSNQIDCLEKNFNQFIKYVKRQRSDSVNEQELASFVTKFFKIDTTSFLNGLRFLFELNMILLNDQQNSISTENIIPLFKIIQKTNLYAVKIYQLLSKTDRENYLVYRDEISSNFSKLMNSILEIVEKKTSKTMKLNIMNFLANLNEKFPDFNIDLKASENFLFLKKLFLGGNQYELKSSEVKKILVKSPKLFQIGLDLYFLNKESFNDPNELYTHYRKLISQMRDLFHPLDDSTPLFNVDDFLNSIDNLANSPIDLAKASEIIKSFQDHMLGKTPGMITFKDLKVGVHYIEILTMVSPYKAEINKMLKGIKEKEYFYKKSIIEEIHQKTTKLSLELKKLIDRNIEFPVEQDILSFSIDLNRIYQFDNDYTEEIIRSLFSIKTFFLGGPRENLHKTELLDLLTKAPDLFTTLLNLSFINKNDLYSDGLKYQYYLNNTNAISELSFSPDKQTGEDQLVMRRNDLINVVNFSNKVSQSDIDNNKSFDISTYIESIDKIKVRILGGDKESYMLSELKQALALSIRTIETSLYFNETYKANQRIFKRTTPITFIPKKDLDIYNIISPSRLDGLFNSFVHQAKVYRYYRGSNGIAYYSSIIKRTRKGFVESAMVNSIFSILQKSYGVIDDGIINFSRENLKNLLYDFKPMLIEHNMWTVNFDNFIRNVLLLSDLFQNSSNGTGALDLDETTEFGVLVLQITKLSEQVFTQLKAIANSNRPNYDGINCKPVILDSLSYPVSCHRKYFFDIFLNKLNHKKDFPKFYQFYQESSEEELDTLLMHLEGFSREYKDPTRPMSQRDYGMVIGSILNIESTFIRFDADEDNVLNPHELDMAFDLYKSAIIKLADLSGGKVKYAKSIYLYMIKNMKVPTRLQLINFHYNPFVDRDITAKRTNLGALLYYLVYK
jgi:hypothetical protein